MDFKAGKHIAWEDIEVGEIFAFMGCWTIMEKVSNSKVRVLAQDNYRLLFSAKPNDITGQCFIDCLHSSYLLDFLGTVAILGNLNVDCYKLSDAMQALWRTS